MESLSVELGLWGKGDKERRSLSLSCSVDDSGDKMVSRDFGRVVLLSPRGLAGSERVTSDCVRSWIPSIL